ncbi:hypothetical protein BDW59DRAFT_110204 [Aspergillus cavernicola]|uniref:Secreted protein n=1 Tax=Aspergillus cavernicola TaxID=176166 RepID=A0ABR4I154_9EURO
MNRCVFRYIFFFILSYFISISFNSIQFNPIQRVRDRTLLTCYSFFFTLQKPKTKKTNSINYHMMRMYPKVVGPKKKQGSLG